MQQRRRGRVVDEDFFFLDNKDKMYTLHFIHNSIFEILSHFFFKAKQTVF